EEISHGSHGSIPSRHRAVRPAWTGARTNPGGQAVAPLWLAPDLTDLIRVHPRSPVLSQRRDLGWEPPPRSGNVAEALYSGGTRALDGRRSWRLRLPPSRSRSPSPKD